VLIRFETSDSKSTRGGRKLKTNFALLQSFTRVKFKGEMDEMSERIFHARPRTQPPIGLYYWQGAVRQSEIL